MTALGACGDGSQIAMVTDGRFSGRNSLLTAHVAAEAALGGPLALPRDGDAIEIGVNGRRLAESTVPLSGGRGLLKARSGPSRWLQPKPTTLAGAVKQHPDRPVRADRLLEALNCRHDHADGSGEKEDQYRNVERRGDGSPHSFAPSPDHVQRDREQYQDLECGAGNRSDLEPQHVRGQGGQGQSKQPATRSDEIRHRQAILPHRLAGAR